MTRVASPLDAFHRSNALTYASLCAGMTAVSSAMSGSAAGAGALIAAAVIFDTFDGAFARRFTRTPTQREIGVQLDSLADAIVFGFVPVVCMWLLAKDGGWGLSIAGPVYTAHAITRLAFYNVTHETREGFVGVPVPVAALIWSTALLMQPGTPVTTLVTLGAAAAMILPIPIPRPRGAALAAFTCWPLAVLVAHVLAVR